MKNQHPNLRLEIENYAKAKNFPQKSIKIKEKANKNKSKTHETLIKKKKKQILKLFKSKT